MMKANRTRGNIGIWNSSITRVRPVMSHLIRRDPSGLTWLSRLMECAKRDCPVHLPAQGSTILSRCTVPRPYEDRVLKTYGISTIDLPECFEHDIPPPTAFLRWLILNPGSMKSMEHASRSTSETQDLRDALFGRHGATRQMEVQRQALGLVDRLGALGSRRAWWAFEGFTSVDCYLETDDFVLLIEGKRKEPLSGSTKWYPARNQLIRNLEAASEFAHGKNYGLLLVVESKAGIPQISPMLADSLPHLNSDQRASLESHYLGATTWREVCDATSFDSSDLPDTTLDVVNKLKG